MEKEIIKFELSGMSACIRKPESNTTYFTYNNPHKVTLLGILGAIIGKNGYNYNAFNDIDELPDCYIHLRNLKIGIEPLGLYGNFSKKLQVFNNSVGYASQEQGGNLIVREQWLENPKWNIYILSDDSDVYKEIKDYLINSKCEYIPYIGKNEHFATINEIEVLNAFGQEQRELKIDSLIIKEYIEIKEKDIADLIFTYNETKESNVDFEYTEMLPTELDKTVGYINYKPFIFTNKELVVRSNNVYCVNGKNIFFN